MRIARALTATATAAGLSLALLGAAPAVAAEPTATIKLIPATKTVGPNTVFKLKVKVDTGGQAVNTVQFYINLPDAQLDCKKVSIISAAWPNQAAILCDSSTAALAVYSNSGESFNGVAKFAEIKLKTKSVTGDALVEFDPDATYVVSAETSEDILGSMSGSVVTITP